LLATIEEQAVAVAVGQVEAEQIDRTDILRATLQAMRLALTELAVPPEHVLVDGPHGPGSGWPETAVRDGDARSLSVAAASVVAKVRRDRMMAENDVRFPHYGFARHKGYGTAEHLAALRERGPCALHRRTFAPVQACLQQGYSATFRALARQLAASPDTGALAEAARLVREARKGLDSSELEQLRCLYRRRERQLGDHGQRAEDLAAEYLQARGYAVLHRRYRGAGGEIDLVARQGDCLVFVEVKSSWGRTLGRPEDRVSAAKRQHLTRAASRYLQAQGAGLTCRFDVVVVEAGAAGPRITHLDNAFQASGSR
jgi:uncharacterized protein (TIGR00252 family)